MKVRVKTMTFMGPGELRAYSVTITAEPGRDDDNSNSVHITKTCCATAPHEKPDLKYAAEFALEELESIVEQARAQLRLEGLVS